MSVPIHTLCVGLLHGSSPIPKPPAPEQPCCATCGSALGGAAAMWPSPRPSAWQRWRCHISHPLPEPSHGGALNKHEAASAPVTDQSPPLLTTAAATTTPSPSRHPQRRHHHRHLSPLPVLAPLSHACRRLPPLPPKSAGTEETGMANPIPD